MSVKHVCEIMKVSTSGYSESLCGNESPRQFRDRIRAQHIKEIFHKHKGSYGTRASRRSLPESGISSGPEDAFRARKPAAWLIVQSDRGSQFASNKFHDALTEADALSSMSGGNCYDNVCAESFFHSLKVERVYRLNVYATRDLAKADILSYFYYGRTHIHSHWGYLSPYAFENLSILEHSFDPAV